VFSQLGNRKWVRDKRWKLLGTGELYDLRNDPWEERVIPANEGGDAAAARSRLTAVLGKLKA
jgi:arylsulfatase A-like enzyme